MEQCQIAFFMSSPMLRNLHPSFCHYFLCHLSYRNQFDWYPGYHGYQFYAALLREASVIVYFSPISSAVFQWQRTNNIVKSQRNEYKHGPFSKTMDVISETIKQYNITIH